MAGSNCLETTEAVPSLVSWNITRRCNLNCGHCYLPSGGGGGEELSTAGGYAVIDQLAQCGTEMLILTGGEPLLRSDLFDLARYASGRGITVVLGTNGTLLTPESARLLVECGVKGVGISLDAVEPEPHDAFRGVAGAWQGALGAMAVCRQERLPFLVQTTATPWNYHRIADMIALAQEQGAYGFTLYFLVCTGRGEALTDITPEQYEQALTLLTEAQAHYSGMMVRARCAPHILRVARERNSPLIGSAGCPAGTSYCRITPEGDVTPCPYLPLSVGNLRQEALAAIWGKSTLLNHLRALDLKGRCGLCEHRAVCKGCRGRAYALSGDPLAEDPWCRYQPAGHAPAPSEVSWDAAALERLERVPGFIRGRVKEAVQKYAAARSQSLVTEETMEEVRRAMGKMPFPWKMAPRIKGGDGSLPTDT